MSIRDITVPCSMPISGGKIAFVAEAPGEVELEQGEVLVGRSGVEFSRMLRDAGITRSECLLTNLFNFKLPANKVEYICGRKKEMPSDYPYPPISPGHYLRPEYFDCLERLKDELEIVKPNVIVPLGNTALWAVCRTTGIGKVRGTVLESTLLPKTKCIPAFHPAAILRQWHNRATSVADFIKARVQAEYPDIRRPHRELWLDPTIEDLAEFESKYIRPDSLLGCDIETAHGFITCFGLAPDPHHAIVIPFVDQSEEDFNYWPNHEQELLAWQWVKRFLEGPHRILWQNGLYDMQWLWRKARIKTMNAAEDTMILHHALQPEVQKSLAFLGSIYTDEVAWKLIRPRGNKPDKREE